MGTDALAGYGIGQRLAFLSIPIAFGIGEASVPMVLYRMVSAAAVKLTPWGPGR